MKVLFDICHPAHVHFFKFPLQTLSEKGHDVLVTSRKKDVSVALLNQFDITHKIISTSSKGNYLSLFSELLSREKKLFEIVGDFKPEILVGIGGIFVAHVGMLRNIPSLVFYDTEHATLQNVLTYPFSSCVIVPNCYQGWVPRKRHIKYAGYHELSYLHPDKFTPDYNLAVKNGLSTVMDTFLIRTVSWQASHDIGKTGWSLPLLTRVVALLQSHGKVIISSEKELPSDLRFFSYKGSPSEIHHLMAFCRGFIGESATMASECSVLGVPSICAANIQRGYLDDQEKKYDLVRNVRQLEWKTIEKAIHWLLSRDKKKVQQARQQLLDDSIDVTKFIVECITEFPRPLTQYQSRDDH